MARTRPKVEPAVFLYTVSVVESVSTNEQFASANEVAFEVSPLLSGIARVVVTLDAVAVLLATESQRM